LVSIVEGRSDLAPGKGDKRFADPACTMPVDGCDPTWFESGVVGAVRKAGVQ
jgi:hypothetical protein